ncbi:MAG: Ldh family oxidoreductase, partial [Gemmatimonadales bacterium]|nr:Ldh family oxidoreductase [Gemmatimonadales bacterium]
MGLACRPGRGGRPLCAAGRDAVRWRQPLECALAPSIETAEGRTSGGLQHPHEEETVKLVRYGRPGREKPGLIDADGNPTDDPSVVTQEPPGALLPIGGIEYGHKGYALGLLVETLTMGLAGHGRADPIEGWTGEVFVQVLNPALFGGADQFLRQTTWVADACRATP